jgi:hypothetical protein
MRSFVTILALASAAAAATSPLIAREDTQACAMQTLLSSTACSTGESACLCSDATRSAVLDEIKSACGAEQSDMTKSLAEEACKTQKMRRATQPTATVVHMGLATPSASATGRMNGAQDNSDPETCTCASNKSNPGSMPSANNAETPLDGQSGMTGTSTHNSNMPSANSPQGNHVNSPSMAAAAPPASSSATLHGAKTAPSSASSSRIATPSGADAYAPFKGAGSQILPSMTAIAGAMFVGAVGFFAAL